MILINTWLKINNHHHKFSECESKRNGGIRINISFDGLIDEMNN